MDGSRSYAYGYDPAGNRIREDVTTGITISTAQWNYNAANQIATMQLGGNPVVNFSYDANGNLLSDGQKTYTWDRADRLRTVDNGSFVTSYAYNGDGDRVRQIAGIAATQYLLDTQPGLTRVLSETSGGTTTNYIHAPTGMHAMQTGMGGWIDPLDDGLGSVRIQLDPMGDVSATQDHAPYGLPFNETGIWEGTFGFAGEQTDANGQGICVRGTTIPHWRSSPVLTRLKA